jgi:aspartate kinase
VQVIAKIGGTSVGKFLDVIATDIVPSAINSKHRIAVVCSARSGATKATGTTNLLLRAALEALRPRANDLSSSISSFNTPSGTPGPSSAEKLNPLTSQIFQRSASQAPLNGAESKSGSTRSGTSTPGGSLAQSLLGLRGGEEGPQQFNATVDQIKHDHIEAARLAVKNATILAELEDDLDYDCERLRSFLLAAQVSSSNRRDPILLPEAAC